MYVQMHVCNEFIIMTIQIEMHLIQKLNVGNMYGHTYSWEYVWSHI